MEQSVEESDFLSPQHFQTPSPWPWEQDTKLNWWNFLTDFCWNLIKPFMDCQYMFCTWFGFYIEWLNLLLIWLFHWPILVNGAPIVPIVKRQNQHVFFVCLGNLWSTFKKNRLVENWTRKSAILYHNFVKM